MKKELSPFIVLLLYSLLPGFAKIFDNQLFFLLNIPIVIWLLHGAKLYNRAFAWVVISYILYSALQSWLYIIFDYGSKPAMYASLYMYILPMVAIFSMQKYGELEIIKAASKLVLVHALIGFLIFGFFEYPVFLSEIIAKLKEGVLPLRMASVSGSLGLGVLCPIGLICSVYIAKEKNIKKYWIFAVIIFFAGIMTQQRSCWLGMMIFLFWYAIRNPRLMLPLIAIFLASLILFLPKFMDDYMLQLMNERFSSLGSVENSAVSERSSMWIGAISNLQNNPLGLGLGQVGLVAVSQGLDARNGISDGDYFRIVSESGVPGILFLSLSLVLILWAKIKARTELEKFSSWIPLVVALQMLGSNVTEFYFSSYLFWFFCGFILARNRNL